MVENNCNVLSLFSPILKPDRPYPKTYNDKEPGTISMKAAKLFCDF